MTVAGKLIVVPTPIGNLDDMTFRAVDVLKKSDIILTEDTRTSGILLKHFEITGKKLWSYHKFNEHKAIDSILNELQMGAMVSLISDAGTPGISDPGYLIVSACIKNDIMVESLPGATAFVPALVNSGLPSHNFVFEGFLPVKKGRQKKLKSLIDEKRTMIFYESPHRIVKTLTEMATYFGAERQASISRELTKIHEETVRGTLTELVAYFTEKSPKGEFVLVVAGKE